MRDKINDRLYPPAPDGGWTVDSAFLAANPALLFRVIDKGGLRYALPISTLGSGPHTIHMSQRGWKALDTKYMWSNRELQPVRDGQPGEPVSLSRGMWENPSYQLDTARFCGNFVPVAQLVKDIGVDFYTINFKAKTGAVSLEGGALQAAIDQVPTLVTPPLGVSAAMLARYKRTLHQITRVGASPSILLEYNDPDPVLDTGSTRGKRPRQLIIVLDKGVYGYKPSWVYSTTKMPQKDQSAIRFLDAIDMSGDGTPELLFTYESFPRYTLVYKQWNDTWRRVWEHNGRACDG